MSKTKFNVLHKNTIIINGTKYRINQLTKEQLENNTIDPCNSRSCSLCDCRLLHDCISNISISNCCTDTIGPYGYLKCINHAKNKV